MTGAELHHAAGALAARLRRGTVVALVLPRGAALVAGVLGARMAGSAYVAVDPTYPDDRVAWMLRDSGASVVCTSEDLGGRLQAPDWITLVLDERGGVATGPMGVSGVPTEAGSTSAYVVYTSGSTGRPKGVMVGPGGLDQLVAWHRRAFGLTAGDRTTLLASPGFDASAWEIWPALAAGATLVAPPDAVRADPRRLRDWMVEAAITVSFVPTVVAEALQRLPWPVDAPLRYLLTGGEMLRSAPPEGLPFEVVNNYGVSEATVVSTSTVVTPGSGPPSIGAPIDGTTVQVVDDDLRPVPDGAPGELLIGGAGLALGYLGRPDLTAARFVIGPDGGRWYRSGDLVCRRPDGQLDYRGRVDDQLSIRGVRIEPGDVTAALDSHPSVARSTVAGQGEGAARRLVAWVVPSGAGHMPLDDLRNHVAQRLPDAMVPSMIVPVDALPTTAHGKVDHGALLAGLEPGVAPHHDGSGEPGAPGPGGAAVRSATEVAVAAVVAELLGVAAVGVDEDFFLLGGHSMLGAELLGRLEDLFGVELSLRSLFDGPTVEEIARSVEAAGLALA